MRLHLVDAHDVGMILRPQGLRLLLHPLLVLRALRELYSRRHPELLIVGEPHLAHASIPQLPHNLKAVIATILEDCTFLNYDSCILPCGS